MRNERLYPISEGMFNRQILPIIEGNYIWKGRPPKVSHYNAFCGMLYILRTCVAWRDLPETFGYWHTVYLSFSRGCERGLWLKIMKTLQEAETLPEITGTMVVIDSTTMKVHRHGGGQKGGSKRKAKDAEG